jgi:UDP-N-acetylglucosamine--N-acetylmuramyl-(pentapeptide) pyrophosphoryl-undecaprenol N-acetylglucosamine transferase
MKVGFAAAGTGGHVYPALAVADELRSRGWPYEDLVFFGGDRMEATVVPAAGYPFVGVDIHGLRRSVTIDNIRLVGRVRAARAHIADVMVRDGIRAMVVFGGYIAGPAALAASKVGVPLVVHEANAVPGLANRMIARRADAVFVAFAPATARLPGSRVVGSPLRAAFATFDRDVVRPVARRRYGIEESGRVLGVVGGSQGAGFLNDVASVLATEANRTYAILHLTGPTHFDQLSGVPASEHFAPWVRIPFESSMEEFYAASDLVLCRGGALTVSELQATGTPAVIVPLPAGRGYQRENAEDLVAAGGAIVVDQDEVPGVVAVVDELLASSERLTDMSAPANGVDHRKAASVIADRIEELTDA